jgi:multidrug efflux system membrane fusion protein
MWAICLLGRSGKHKENPAITGEANHPVIIHAAQHIAVIGVFYIDALGTVTPISTINVFSQVSGPVLAVHYAIAHYCVHVRA